MMIDNADEWFNLYLYLGSCWVNKSRYEARYDTQYDTDLTKESRSIDQAETENHGAERKESRHDSRAEINSFEDYS
jgi:hypothetical protein